MYIGSAILPIKIADLNIIIQTPFLYHGGEGYALSKFVNVSKIAARITNYCKTVSKNESEESAYWQIFKLVCSSIKCPDYIQTIVFQQPTF